MASGSVAYNPEDMQLSDSPNFDGTKSDKLTVDVPKSREISKEKDGGKSSNKKSRADNDKAMNGSKKAGVSIRTCSEIMSKYSPS